MTAWETNVNASYLSIYNSTYQNYNTTLNIQGLLNSQSLNLSLFNVSSNLYVNSTNVGIGTSTPTHTLSVVGSTNITGDLWLRGVNLSTSSGSSLWATNGTSIYNSTVSQVGIGTTTPNALLQVGPASAGYWAGSSYPGYPDVIIGSQTNADELSLGFYSQEGTNNYRLKLFLDDATGNYGFYSTRSTGANNFVIGDGTTEFFRVAGGGNVGIGTSTPSSALQVYGNLTLGKSAISSGNLIFKGNASNIEMYGDYPAPISILMQDNTTNLFKLIFETSTGKTYLNTTGNNPIIFSINNIEKMQLNATALKISSAYIQANGYRSSDGSVGLTADCSVSGDFSVKNGLIVACLQI